MRVLTTGLLSVCLLAFPAMARTLTMPTNADMQLLRSFLAADPPDFEAIASRSEVASAATEFDRADVIARETERLRDAYLEIGDVDRIVLRLDSGLSRYDGAVGGFRLRALEPDRYLAFGSDKLLFENASEFAIWKLSPSEGRKMLSEVGSGRSVQIEIDAVPFAASPSDRLAVRAQIRSLRVVTRDGVTLGELHTNEPRADRVIPGGATRPVIPSDRLELLGLRVGATYEEFQRWIVDRGFEGETIREPVLKTWRYELSFAAEPGVIMPPSDAMSAPRQDFWSPMPIVGEKFACGATSPERRICGSVTFSTEPGVDQKTVTSVRLAQTIGAKSETVSASLTERFGSPSDSFEVELPTWNGYLPARQIVWGAPSPRNDDTLGSVALTGLDRAWQIEALLVEVSVGRTVLIVQTAATSAKTSTAPGEPRL